MIDSIHVAHVAESIARLSGGEVNDYNVTADFAYELISAYPMVKAAVLCFMDDRITPDEFDVTVKTAVLLAGE